MAGSSPAPGTSWPPNPRPPAPLSPRACGSARPQLGPGTPRPAQGAQPAAGAARSRARRWQHRRARPAPPSPARAAGRGRRERARRARRAPSCCNPLPAGTLGWSLLPRGPGADPGFSSGVFPSPFPRCSLAALPCPVLPGSRSRGQPGASRTSRHSRAARPGFVCHSMRSLPSCSMLQGRGSHEAARRETFINKTVLFPLPCGNKERGENSGVVWGQEGLRKSPSCDRSRQGKAAWQRFS